VQRVCVTDRDRRRSATNVTAVAELDEAGFVEKLDKKDIKRIAGKQYAKLAAPVPQCEYRDTVGDRDRDVS
jgi:hypothetical protein